MSKSPSLRAVYNDLVASLHRSSGLLSRSSGFQELRRGRMRKLLPEDIQAIAEFSFLSAFLSWETFLEASFTLYMVGKKSPSGFRPQRYVLPKDPAHAFNIIAQGKKYADWVKVNELRTRAEWYFERGEPFSNVLGAVRKDLEDMMVIRHRIAHMSTSAHKSFEDVVRGRIGSVPKGVTPGSYLLTLDPMRNNYHSYYLTVLEAAALQIVPH
jgi:hypothetical protein